MSLTIRKGTEILSFKSWLFPAGEVGVRLDTDNHRYHNPNHPSLPMGLPSGCHQTITARIQTSQDLMELVMVVDALREWDPTPIHLVLPYLPYGRQDRRCVKGESFSLKAFARLINGLSFERVTIFDAHSDVSASVLDRVKVIDQPTIIGRFDAFNKRLHADPKPVFVSPDAGANKRVSELAGLYGHSTFLRADKLRDLATGKIKEIVVVNPREEVEGKDCVVADDLADGAATFIGLATALKAKGVRRVELYVTHGVWSKGLNHLWDGGIDHIWVTNSYRADTETLTARSLDRLTVLDLEQVFLL